MAFSSWSGLAPALCLPGSSCSCLSLVRATSSWWVQSLVATIPSRSTLWAAVARSWRVTSSEHLWRPGYQGRAELNTGESGARVRPWTRPGDWIGHQGKICWFPGWPTCFFLTWTPDMEQWCMTVIGAGSLPCVCPLIGTSCPPEEVGSDE